MESFTVTKVCNQASIVRVISTDDIFFVSASLFRSFSMAPLMLTLLASLCD